METASAWKDRETVVSRNEGGLLFPLKGNAERQACVNVELPIPIEQGENVSLQEEHLAWFDENLRLAYQPIIDPRTMTTVAHEVLLRPVNGNSPWEMIGKIESRGMFDAFWQWQIRRAFKEIHLVSGETVSFNVMPRQLERPEFAFEIMAVASSLGMPAKAVWIEMVETATATGERGASIIRENARQLRESGATLLIDDFGDGYGTLKRIREEMFDWVKLSGDLVMKADSEKRTARMLMYMLQMLSDLEIPMVAEAVASKKQADWMKGLGVQLFQSFLYGRPIVPEAIQG
jgi:EAL domain-containing protein (putative c-di-GMP-specific phosphodiesterase class I)